MTRRRQFVSGLLLGVLVSCAQPEIQNSTTDNAIIDLQTAAVSTVGIESISPSTDSTGVSVNSGIKVVYAQSMDPLTTTSAINVFQGTYNPAGGVPPCCVPLSQ